MISSSGYALYSSVRFSDFCERKIIAHGKHGIAQNFNTRKHLMLDNKKSCPIRDSFVIFYLNWIVQSGEHAAIYLDNLSGDVSGHIGAEEYAGIGYVFGLAAAL